MERRFVTVDGNEAAAYVAHQLSEVIAIYPITPSSPMGECADDWSAARQTEHLGHGARRSSRCRAKAGAAGALHGALQAGALGTTFTASQGLLLMIPNMFKIAGELTPAVFHVAARAARHARAVDLRRPQRRDGRARHRLGDAGVELGAGGAGLRARSRRPPRSSRASRSCTSSTASAPRTRSTRSSCSTTTTSAAMIDDDVVAAHRDRGLTPDRPVAPRHGAEPRRLLPGARGVQPVLPGRARASSRTSMDEFAELDRPAVPPVRLRTARPTPSASIVVDGLRRAKRSRRPSTRSSRAGEKVGLLKVRLFRPFPTRQLRRRAARRRVRAIAVLDRTKEPGAVGEPLYQDVVTALAEAWTRRMRRSADCPRVIGGRYGLSSKEFTPAMVKARLRRAGRAEPQAPLHRRHRRRRHPPEPAGTTRRSPPSRDDVVRAVFYGLGSDGTVGANKNSIKIIGESTDRCTRRATSSTTPRSRARSPSRTCASARSRSARPT